MSAPRRPLLLACQSTMAAATAAVLCLPAMSVVALDIVPSVPGVTAAPRVVEPRTRIEGRQEPATAVVATQPVEPTVSEVPLESREVRKPTPPTTGSAGPTGSALLTHAIDVDGYATVGVTWSNRSSVDEDDIALTLSSSRHGRWSAWEEMHFDPDHEPDPGGPETDATARPGTDAVVVGAVDAVRVRVRALRGSLPEDLELAVIDPGVDRAMSRQSGAALQGQGAGAASADPGAATQAAQAVVLTASSAPRPTIYSRAQWGANESLRDKGSLRYGSIHAGFVHHTVNSNGYSRNQVPSIIRGIYAYHTQSRGWSDIGYNFLVDRFGRIWEGRYGGVARPVVGAHTLGYNDYSFAMSAIGNYDITSPSSAMLDAYGRLFAWKLSLAGVKASSTRQRVGSRYFAAISGHRDAGQTACPGRYLYAKIPDIRSRAARIQKSGGGTSGGGTSGTTRTATDPRTSVSGAHWPDVASRRGNALTLNRTGGQIRFRKSTIAGKGWGGKDLVTAAGDMTGDGIGDVVARNRSSQVASLFTGNGRGGYSGAVRTYGRFSEVDSLIGVGDFDGDGNDDLVGRMKDNGRLMLFPGRAGNGLKAPVQLAASWDYPLTAAGGDLDGDARPDLVARRDGRLYLVRGLGNRLAAPVAMKRGWAKYDAISGGHDLTGDGRDDLLVRVGSTKDSYIFPGNDDGEVGRRYGPYGAFRNMGWFAVNGQLAKGKGRDVVGINAGNGQLRVFGNSGRQNLGKTIVPGVSLGNADSVFPVGDWNKDGRGDLMYREAGSGRLMFLANRGKDSFASPVVAGTGFGDVTGLVAAGDLNGDGKADLMGENANSVIRVYKGDGKTGFDGGFAASRGDAAAAGKHHGVVVRRANGSVWLWRPVVGGGPMKSTQVAADASRYDWFMALGDADGDGTLDILARAKATKLLWLIPVTSSGFGTRRYVSEDLKDRDALR